jgi:putative transposase
MPRIARIVFSEMPHHVTQRGNRRGNVFFTDDDRYQYMKWLKEYCKKHQVSLLAYCLMKNHVHLIVVPKQADGLQRAFKPLHMRYAQYINRQQNWSGHLWQGRFFSSVLDDAYLYAAVRYVELNPVRANLVEKAEDYPWSSAVAHCGLGIDTLLDFHHPAWKIFEDIKDWSAWLQEGDNPNDLEIFRRNINKNLPCGSKDFIEKLEDLTGKVLRFRPIGRPKKEKG